MEQQAPPKKLPVFIVLGVGALLAIYFMRIVSKE